MKVTETTPVAPLPGSGEVPREAREAAPRAPDRVSTEQTARITAAISAASQGASSARAARLRNIEAAVQSGTYKPDPQRIAQQILDEAELSARVQALLSP
jgi:negative regulator of flagellin synthesis FlgM